jgi:hypothetical protein
VTVGFLRFRCSEGHTFAVKFTTNIEIEAEYCAVCGDTDVERLEDNHVDADVLADSNVLGRESL